MSEPIDLTSKILEDIRDELRGHGEELRGLRVDVRGNTERLERVETTLVAQNGRMELIETVLRDLAGQIVMLGRGVKAALESRARDDERFDDHERRISALEHASVET